MGKKRRNIYKLRRRTMSDSTGSATVAQLGGDWADDGSDTGAPIGFNADGASVGTVAPTATGSLNRVEGLCNKLDELSNALRDGDLPDDVANDPRVISQLVLGAAHGAFSRNKRQRDTVNFILSLLGSIGVSNFRYTVQCWMALFQQWGVGVANVFGDFANDTKRDRKEVVEYFITLLRMPAVKKLNNSAIALQLLDDISQLSPDVQTALGSVLDLVEQDVGRLPKDARPKRQQGSQRQKGGQQHRHGGGQQRRGQRQ